MQSALSISGTALALVSLAACGNDPAPSGGSQGIVFSQNLDGYNVISVVQPGGGEPERLTADPAPSTDSSGDVNPAWSPDGTRIAYASSAYALEEDQALTEIYVMDADGGNPRRLTHDKTMDYFPAWSPDGTRIAASRIVDVGTKDVAGAIVIMDVESGDFDEITHPEPNEGEMVTIDTMPAWSPDGSRIAFTRFTYAIEGDDFQDAPIDIYTVDPDGTGETLLLRDGGGAEWSPDGSQVVFTSTRDQNGEICFEECSWNGEIYVANADGTNVRRLTDDEADDGAPAWSPDGTQIVFVSSRTSRSDHQNDIEYELYVMDADGRNVERLTTSKGVWAGEPDWR